ncbi:TonB-dependent receptor [Alteromonas sp. ASW11-36]|uniref:TonB-dependent receptor n=1 Tax=Alteromonas arenosi TaxID=3055817 RepID=A0ABT7SSD0_9ALTE|nr:TonB-dependent receptor [Alteromonas sp. ASW11-36]MDM7859103.1 TonB-dependent receptor [Alteromonas sp. ASW11-36]
MKTAKTNRLAMCIKTALLSTALGGAAFTSGHALAQSGDAADNIERIAVTGIRASNKENLNNKRYADGILDAINAEDIGKFPDQNVAESLQRIPGVTIQRQFGEGAGVSIRGAGLDLTLTTLNGQNVASTGWFVLEPAKRSFNYELLPSELVGKLEVYKSSQADLAEGGVGGTVVVKTRKPLDLDTGTFYGSVEGQYQSDSGETDPQLSGLYSWKNEDENFGFLVSAVKQQRSLQRQGNEAFWEWGAGPVGFTQDRDRQSLNATFQYQPTDSLELVLNVIDMEMDANNTNYALWLTQADTSWGAGETTAWIGGNGTAPTIGTQAAGPLNVAFYQARPREASMKSDVIDLTLNYSTDDYDLTIQVGDTSSTGGTDFEMVVDDGTGGTPIVNGTYDFTNGNQTWSLPNLDIASYDPGSLVMGQGAAFNKTPKTDDETYAQFDVLFNVDYGPVESIKTGVKFSKHETTSRQFFFDQADGFDNRISTSGLSLGTYDVGAGNYQIQQFDAEALKAWAKASIVGQTEDLGTYSGIEEDNFAIYAMANYSTDGIRGNFGVRYVTTDATSNYYLDDVYTSTEADYAELLPSFNMTMDLQDDLLLRFSAARVMARPQYDDMYVNPSPVGANDDTPNNQFWIIGNVGLAPFVSNQFDLGLEWYFNDDSLLSATLFKKDVKNFVTINEYTASQDEIQFQGVLRPDETEWTVQEKDNGKAAEIEGVELQYQQDFGNGFGTIFNYTYTDTKADEDTFTDANSVLSDSSRHSYNVSGYYETDDFQVRVSYNWRSEYMLRESGAYGNRLHDDFGSLDLTAIYSVTDNIDVRFAVNNLTEESSVQKGNNNFQTNYSGFARGFPLYEYEMARRITAGVLVRF